MNDDLTNSSEFALLLESHRWTVYGSGAGDEPQPSRRPLVKRRRWSQENVHSHDVIELMLCVKGAGVFGMGGELYEYEPGALFLLGPGTEHDYEYPPKTGPVEHIWLRFMGAPVMVAWLSIDKGKVSRKYSQYAVAGEDELGISLKTFLQPLTDHSPLERAAGARLLAGVITRHLAKRLLGAESQAKPSDKAALHLEVTQAICRHIQDTNGRGVDLEGLAHLTGYSKFYLTRMFRQEMGCTIHEYIDRVRLGKIAALEADGETNASISRTLGFSCPTAYIRWRRRTRPEAPGAMGVQQHRER